MVSAGTYLRTLRDLKFNQVTDRVLRAWPKTLSQAVGDPPRRPIKQVPRWPQWRAPVFVGGDFQLFGQAERVVRPADWTDPTRDELLTYHLHYLDHLTSAGSAHIQQCRDLIAWWSRDNPPFRGQGWDPYPVSRRVVNLVRWSLGCGEGDPDLHRLIYLHGRCLSQSLEYHLRGNHLLANAVGLIFAGCFFQTRESENWLSTGLELFKSQLREQFLSDGGHFERSPMYHALCLGDLLDVMLLLRGYEIQTDLDAKPLVEQAIRWLNAMSLPSGRLFRFNDTADDQAPPPAVLRELAEQFGIRSASDFDPGMTVLKPSGYLRWSGDDYVCVIDIGEIGPRYQPGHAHCDTLSFELAWQGEPVIVNTGTSTYHDLRRRNIERGTKAHNTLSLEGHEQSEIWAKFRVGRKARVSATTIGEKVLIAEHDGWRPLGVVHQRRFEFEANGLIVTDRVTGLGDRLADVHLHFAPGVDVSPTDNGLQCGQLAVSVDDGRMETYPYECAVGFFHCLPAVAARTRVTQEVVTRLHGNA